MNLHAFGPDWESSVPCQRGRNGWLVDRLPDPISDDLVLIGPVEGEWADVWADTPEVVHIPTHKGRRVTAADLQAWSARGVLDRMPMAAERT